MLARSPFLQAALQRPWYSYLLVLARLSPIHLLGLFVGLATIHLVLTRLYTRLLAGGWVLLVSSHLSTWTDRASKKINASRFNTSQYKLVWRRLASAAAAVHTGVQRRTQVKLLEEHRETEVLSTPGAGGVPTPIKAGESTVWMQQQMQQQVGRGRGRRGGWKMKGGGNERKGELCRLYFSENTSER